MVALETNLHPLAGLRSAYYLCERKSLRSLTWLRRWLIRLVYFKCEWSSDYCIHDVGIFTDRDAAEAVARIKSDETGNAWSVKELPVNGILPDVSVRYGFYSFPTSEADKYYRTHKTRFEAVESKHLELLKHVEQQADDLLKSARAG